MYVKTIFVYATKFAAMQDSSSHAPVAAAAFTAPGQYTPDQSVGFLMRKVLSSILSQADAQLSVHDVTYVQYLPLYKLMHCSECNTVAALSRELEIDAGAMTRSLDRLQAKGLVCRERSTTDRRVVHVALTDAGREVAAKVPGVLAEVLNGHLSDFSHGEWQQLLRLLQRMLANGEALRQSSGKHAG